METRYNDILFREKLATLFAKNRQIIGAGDIKQMPALRDKAYKLFEKTGFPDTKNEDWRNTNLKNAFAHNYNILFEPPADKPDIEKIFQCNIHNFDTHIIALYNGWYLSEDKHLTTLPNGTITGSLAQAIKEYPELVEKHLNKLADINENGFTALNTAFAQDGIFIYVPDGVQAYKTIQMVNILDGDEKLFIQNRNLIIVGKNARLTFLHCDDSYNYNRSFTNTVTEVFIGEGAEVDHYKLQNLNDNSTLINTTYFHQKKESKLKTNAITLNGGLIRNKSNVLLNGKNAKADIYGLYLVDKEQHIDNLVFVDHAKPDCDSNELFKGIVDDNATAVFNGHILVRKDSQHTNASQTNRNIQLTDKATVYAKPFLEIYADDVKCSHGATIGQLDEEALFYIKSRGIGEYDARLLLLYAFAAEVVNKISVGALRENIDDLVKKRLRGELAICDMCVLQCKTQEKTYEFEIDLSKI
jgi:Fe-S cluster assembly protein SufD